jgi:hypothetical protein
MAKVLFLDDAIERQKKAPQFFVGHSMLRAMSAPEAVGLLKEHEFDMVCLDHDLAEEHYAASFQSDAVQAALPGTGMDVVRFMCSPEYTPQKRPEVVVHSLNHSAAHRMFDSLKEAGYRVTLKPFTTWR